ncbi:MAG: hypothetical protein L6R38_001173 [Xanthoria sp. 2 TBL-2021]|nr:MAG: hypothetical protein L6R38_001173 [Xanthoria sp. 2 TBL-2021]
MPPKATVIGSYDGTGEWQIVTKPFQYSFIPRFINFNPTPEEDEEQRIKYEEAYDKPSSHFLPLYQLDFILRKQIEKTESSAFKEE